MEKAVVLVCSLLISNGCADTNLEVCSTSIQPVQDTRVELQHTNKVNPGTMCQCTAKAECLSASSPSPQINPIPEGVLVNRSIDELSEDRIFCEIILQFQAEKLSEMVLNITDPSMVQVLCKVLQTADNDQEPFPVMAVVISCSVSIFVLIAIILVYCLRRRCLTEAYYMTIMKERHQGDESTTPDGEQDNRNRTSHGPHEQSNGYTYIDTTEFQKVDVQMKDGTTRTDGGYDHLGRGYGRQLHFGTGTSSPVNINLSKTSYDHIFCGKEVAEGEGTSTYNQAHLGQLGYDHVMRENGGKTPRTEDILNATSCNTYYILDGNNQDGRNGSNKDECCNSTYDHTRLFKNNVTRDTGDKCNAREKNGLTHDATRNNSRNNAYELGMSWNVVEP